MFGTALGYIFRGASTIIFKAIKYSPEISMALGLVTTSGAVVSAVNATLDVKEKVLDKAQEGMAAIEEAKTNHPDEYPDECYKKDLMTVRKDTAIGLVKLYWPTFVLFVVGTGLYFNAFGRMKGRYLGTLAALKIAEEENRSLKAERDARQNGEYEVKDAAPGEVGEEATVVKPGKGPKAYSQYARYFDESSSEWSKTPEYNLMFLKAKETYFTNLLQARGHVFLNEVYDELGIPRSQAGQVVGWVLGKGHDNYVSFGLYDLYKDQNRDFVNGTEPSILLDFNVDGVIMDDI